MPPGMADALQVLILKTDKPKSIKQFCPICLCNVTFKILMKVIVNRLKEVIGNLVSLNQGSFIPRKQIGDDIINFQELIDTLKHKTSKEGGMVIKIDL